MSDFVLTISHNAREVADAIAKAPATVLAELDRAIARGAAELTREARLRAPKANTELTNAIAPERITLLEHHVRAAKRYASYQEEGTGPGGRPTLAAIMQWIRRKGIVPRDGMTLRDLAFLIRRKIARVGVPAQPYMKPALEAKRSRLDQLFRDATARGLAQVQQGRAL